MHVLSIKVRHVDAPLETEILLLTMDSQVLSVLSLCVNGIFAETNEDHVYNERSACSSMSMNE